MLGGKFVRQAAHLLDLRGRSVFGLIDAGHGTDDGFVAVEIFFQGKGNFAERGASAGRFNGQRQQISLRRFRRDLVRASSAAWTLCAVAVGLEFLQTLDLRFADGGVVHFANFQLLRFFQPEGY